MFLFYRRKSVLINENSLVREGFEMFYNQIDLKKHTFRLKTVDSKSAVKILF